MKAKNFIMAFLLACAVPCLSFANSSKLDELMELMGINEQLMGGFESMLPMIEQMAEELNLEEDAKAELTEIYRSWFKHDMDHDALVSDIKKMYGEMFTEEEIESLIEFYSTPLGKKMLALLPDMTARGAKLGMEEAERKQHLLMKRLEPFFEKHLNP